LSIGSSTVSAQSALLGRRSLLTVKWFGPFAITPNDTARFNYTNLGSQAVRIEWAFTNALTGDQVCGNFGKPTLVQAGQGAIWDYSQTIATDPATGKVVETRHCDGQDVVSDELYFDATSRHGLVAWIFISHLSEQGMRTAVDLPTVELFNSMVMRGQDGEPLRSMTFGRAFAVIEANPVAPAEFPRSFQR
jgi:hypothetical protein